MDDFLLSWLICILDCGMMIESLCLDSRIELPLSGKRVLL
jgi:hypothetical protein